MSSLPQASWNYEVSHCDRWGQPPVPVQLGYWAELPFILSSGPFLNLEYFLHSPVEVSGLWQTPGGPSLHMQVSLPLFVPSLPSSAHQSRALRISMPFPKRQVFIGFHQETLSRQSAGYNCWANLYTYLWLTFYITGDFIVLHLLHLFSPHPTLPWATHLFCLYDSAFLFFFFFRFQI